MKSKKEVFCLGHISVDIFVDRLALNNLRLGGCIDSHNLAIQGGGDAANVSFWLGKLKTVVSMIGIIGDDPAGTFLRNELESVNVNCQLKISKQFPTGTILIIIEPDGERSFIANQKIHNHIEWNDLSLDKVLNSILFYTSGYNIENPPTKNTIKRLFRQIKSNHNSTPLTMFNLAAYTTVEKFKEEIISTILPYTDILVGNKKEFEALVGILNQSSVNNLEKQYVFDIGRKILKNNPNLRIVLITDGGNGCYCLTEDYKNHIPAQPISIIDTTGAGDAFCAGFIKGYISGKELEQAVKFGMFLGEKVCLGYGARYGASENLEVIF